MAMPKILLVDDDAALTGMLTEFLGVEGFEASAAFNGADGIRAAREKQVDAVILDVMMPDLSGLDVLRQIRTFSSVPVIMLTAKGAEDDRVAGLEIGADDYIAKPYYARELLARLKAVLRRQPLTQMPGPERLSAGGLLLIPAKREVSYNGAPMELTTSEFELLEGLLRAGDTVATKDELSLQVLGRKRQPYDRSIDVHVSNLRKKLDACSQKAVRIETIRGVGYRLRAAR
ncbi:MAG TPA: response regulator transcription factor [Rhizomicrobium sp.]|nr:response regulator transcription factor [Rhizomicrobium sp.]